jgi:hypothetical protein
MLLDEKRALPLITFHLAAGLSPEDYFRPEYRNGVDSLAGHSIINRLKEETDS